MCSLRTLLLSSAVRFGDAIRGAAAGRHTLRSPGVPQPVEIIRDRWGINHIYAQNEPDLFFAQGYAAARDRLFQFEMWRRQATGTVAEILGRARADARSRRAAASCSGATWTPS